MQLTDGMNFYPAQTPQATLLLVHGAGASVQSDFFLQLLPVLQAANLQCWTANFGYMQQTLAGQRKVAPRAEKLLPELTAMLDYVRKLSGTALPIWLVGKSMGGRVCSLWLAQPESDVSAVTGALVLGYPLCPPAKAKQPALQAEVCQQRSAHFTQLRKPLLLAQGSRDAFGSAASLASWAAAAPLCQVLALPGADHDFNSRKQDALNRLALFRELCQRINWQTGECTWINSGAAVLA